MDNFRTDLTFKDVDEGWATARLGDVVSFKVTNSFSRENLNYENGNVKNIHYGDIHTKFQTLFDVVKESVPFINPDIDIQKVKEESYCQEGDLVLADASEDLTDVGKSIEIVNLNNEKLVSGLHTILARPNKGVFPKGFIGYLFKSDSIRKQIQKEAQGAKVLGISATRLQNLIIHYPLSIIHSTKIASCLSSLDEVIAAHSQKLELLKEHKKGLMQNLFPQEGEKVPKYRFKEFEKDGEWVEDILFNLALDGFANGVFNDPKKVGTGYKLINVINMYSESPISENNLTLLELSEAEFDKNKVVYGDIFFTRSSLVPEGIAKSNIYLGSSKNITYDGHLIRMRPNKELIYPVYLHYLLKTENVRRQMIAKGKTATMTTIGQSDVASVKTSYSKNPKEQQKIASCLSSLDALITAQAEKIEQLQQHKKGLMQGLFPKIND